VALTFKPVVTDEEIAVLAKMANEIWHEYWPSRIGLEQTTYMVEQFQSLSAITAAIREEGYLYWVFEDEGKLVGYTGVHPEEENGKLFISKIYLFATERGKGFASEAIAFLEDLCQKRNFDAMYLTVNKDNELAKTAYFAKGFTIIDEVTKPIGEGFYMYDLIMEKKLA